RSSGPVGSDADLGLRSARTRGAVCDEGPDDYERYGGLCQYPAAVAAYEQGAAGNEDVAGADYGERNDAMVSLAGRQTAGFTLAGTGPEVFPMDCSESAAFRERGIAGEYRRGVFATNECLLQSSGTKRCYRLLTRHLSGPVTGPDSFRLCS